MNPALSHVLRAFVKGKTHHSYIFAGPEGVGRKTAARELAAALIRYENFSTADLQDEKFRADPAYAEIHGRVDRGMHPDFTWIEPEEKTLKVDDVRGLARELSYPPLQGKRRVIVVNDAEKMQAAAANSILKTLEEPPPYVVFILVTLSPELLLPTILSRSQLVRFAPLADAEVERILKTGKFPALPEGEPAPDFSAAEIAAAVRWSAGSVTRARRYLTDADYRAVADQATEALFRLWETNSGPALETLAFIETLKAAADIRLALAAWLKLLQDVAAAEAGAPAERFPETLRARLYKVADKIKAKPGKAFAERASSIDLALRELDANVNPKLALVTLCGALRL